MALGAAVDSFNVSLQKIIYCFRYRDMSKNGTFLDSKTYSTDCCAREAKDAQNEQIAGWQLYQYLPVPCETPNMRSPVFQYDHPNLRAGIGYGVSDGCVIDQDSSIRNNPNALTRDRCRIQLFQRIFQGCPNLKPTLEDPGAELPMLEGVSSTSLEGNVISCKKAIMEQETSHRIPLVDCMKDVQDPVHIVPTWTWGGEPTRDYVRRKEFLNRCGYGMKTLH
jgi:hypothetical protein